MNKRQEREQESIFLKIPFLAVLEEPEREELLQRALCRDFRRNEIILNEDDTSDYLYLILSGEVKVIQISERGEEHILAIHKKGDFFGEMALLDGKTSPATVVALKDGRVCLITRETFARTIMTKPMVTSRIIDMLCMRLRQAWLQIRVMSFENAEHRIRAVLNELGEKFGFRDSRGIMISFGITHQNIADMSTTSRETVTRFLSKATKAGEIEILAHKVILLKDSFFCRDH